MLVLASMGVNNDSVQPAIGLESLNIHAAVGEVSFNAKPMRRRKFPQLLAPLMLQKSRVRKKRLGMEKGIRRMDNCVIKEGTQSHSAAMILHSAVHEKGGNVAETADVKVVNSVAIVSLAGGVEKGCIVSMADSDIKRCNQRIFCNFGLESGDKLWRAISNLGVVRLIL